MLAREILYSHYQDKDVLCYRLVYQSMSARAGQGDIVFSLSGQGCAMLQVSC